MCWHASYFLTIVSEPVEALVGFVMINDLYAFSRMYFSCFEFLPHWNASIDISYLLFISVHLKKNPSEDTF